MLQFTEQFGLLFLVIVIISFIIKILKQPIIIGYVLSGLFFALLLSKELISDEIKIIAELGITFLLFLMGLEFDLKSLKYLGKDIFITCLAQSIVFFVISFIISHSFGFNLISSLYLSILFMFSSTLLVAKWVEDKKETETIHGKMIIGTLVMQDIFAIIAITALVLLKSSSIDTVLLAPLKGILLIGIAFVFSRYILRYLLKTASRYPELLFIFSIGVCFFFSVIAPMLGYSATIGAFIAGVVLANTIYRIEISSRLKPLIAFFNMLFFVGLGFQIDFTINLTGILIIASFFLLSLLLKPLIVYITLRARGYDYKTSFLSGVYLAQISEFGIIIAATGVSDKLIGNEIYSIGIILLVSTMVLSSYTIKSAQSLFNLFSKHIRKIEQKLDIKDKMSFETQEYNVVFFGYYDLSSDLMNRMKTLSKKIVVVENDPEKIAILKSEGYNLIYGSVTNPEFFENMHFEKVELVVSNLIDKNENQMIVTELKSKNPKAMAIVTAKSLKDAIFLYDNNADYVIFTSYLNNQQVSVLLEDFTTDINKVIAQKISHFTRLKEIEQKRENAYKNMVVDIDKFLNGFSKQKKHNIKNKK